MNKLLTGIMLFGVLTSSISLAQLKTNEPTTLRNEKGNGGDLDKVSIATTKSLIRENLFKIQRFFNNNDGLNTTFREFDILALVRLIDEVQVEVTTDVLIDKDGIERTALNFPENKTIIYNLARLQQEKIHPEAIFVLNLHELLGLLGINEEAYEVSLRISKYVEHVNSFDLVFIKEFQTPAKKVFVNEYFCKSVLEKKLVRVEKKLDKVSSFGSYLVHALLGFGVPGLVRNGFVEEKMIDLYFNYNMFTKALSIAHLSDNDRHSYRIQKYLPRVMAIRKKRFKRYNKNRVDNGFSEITMSDFNKDQPLKTELEKLSSTYNPIESERFTQMTNHRLSRKWSFTDKELRTFLEDKQDTDYFCKNGKAINLNRAGLKKLILDIRKSSKP